MHQEKRGLEFYVLSAFFLLFVLFLYGPLSAILILSFQGPDGGLTFPLNGVSLHWFANLFERQAVGDFGGSFTRSFVLGLMVMAVTVTVSLLAGLAFRQKFRGATALFYLSVASLVVPSIVISLGIGVVFQQIGLRPSWYGSAFGAHLTWTLAVRRADHVRRLQSLFAGLRGGGARSRRQFVAGLLPRRAADHRAEPDRRRPVRLHAFL